MKHNDFRGGKAARDAGMASVLANAGKEWREKVYALLRAQPVAIKEPFLAEDFVAYAKPRVGFPHHHNAWSSVWGAAKRWRLFLPVGEQRPMRKKSSHARKDNMYVWNRDR